MRLPKHIESGTSDWPLDLAAEYEHGALFIYRNLEVPYIERLSQVTCRSDARIYKKMSVGRLTKPLGPGHHIYQLTEDTKEAVHLQNILREAHDAIKKTVMALFPSYEWTDTKELSSFRFARTENEDIHWDIYNNPDPLVRAFVNLDSEPRVWNVGPLLTDYYEERGKELKTDPLDDLGTLARVAGIRFDREHDGPIERIEFEPGMLWIVQSQLVAHQIIYGRRMYALSLSYNEASMADRSYSPAGTAQRIKEMLR